MLASTTFFFALGAVLSLPSYTVGGHLVQRQGLAVPSQLATYTDEVKAIFSDSYAAYRCVAPCLNYSAESCADINREYAFGHDDVAPISEGQFGFGFLLWVNRD